MFILKYWALDGWTLINISFQSNLNTSRGQQINSKIKVRGPTNGIFNPWVRWITGLALVKNSSVAVALPAHLPTCPPTYIHTHSQWVRRVDFGKVFMAPANKRVFIG